jgi:hypothetical protein
MNPDEDNAAGQGEEPKKPYISIGGAAPARDDKPQEDTTDYTVPGVVRQTVIMGQQNKDSDDDKNQVLVIGPQMQEEQKKANQEYLSNSQIKKAAQKKQRPKHRKLFIGLFLVLLFVGAGAAYYVIYIY